MPYLKMKTKVSTGCLREKKDFHVCQKSNIISKRSCSSVRISDQVAELDTSIQIVSSSIQVSSKDIASSESVDDKQLLDEGNSQSQHLPSFSVDPDMGKMESRNTCSSNLETIFSPVFEPFKVRSEPNDGNDAVGSVSHTDKLHLGADDSNDNRSFCGYETCDISDFYISDMIVSSLPFNENAFDDDNAENNCSLDYGSGEPNMLFDVADHYLILPSFEETVKTSNTPNVQSHEETITVPDNTSLYSAIGQLRSSNQESDIKYDLDQAECFDPLLFIKNLPELSDAVANYHPTVLPKESRKRNSVTLVLDLDETLVHSTLEHCNDADFTFTVFFNMKEHTVYVKQRPYLHTFLDRVAEMFEVVIFTASQSIYAEQLLDILDPDTKLISRRVYRESCIFSDGSYTKDLTVLGVDLAKIAIIDNSPQVFRLQVNNGIPITSWFDDPSDCCLISLLPFLETLSNADDVRPIIAERFGLGWTLSTFIISIGLPNL